MPIYKFQRISELDGANYQMVDPANQLMPILLHPLDIEKRDGLFRALNCFAFQGWLTANPQIDTLPVSIAHEMAQHGDCHRISRDIDSQFGEARDMGEQVGAFLLYALAMERKAPGLVTRRRIIDALTASLKARRREKVSHLSVGRYVEAAFERFGTVAHLWTAYKVLKSDGRFGDVFPCAPEHLNDFLLVSEELRRFGEGFCPQGGCAPILDGKTVWRSPVDYNIDGTGNVIGFTETPEGIQTSLSMQGGRPRTYDWDAFDIELRKRFEYHGRIYKSDPEFGSITQVTDMMLQWCEDSWGAQPSKSIAFERVSTVAAGWRESQ
ncbi:MAG: hypothetical protein WCO00_00560 [Rhodospirillaceae bacterium]